MSGCFLLDAWMFVRRNLISNFDDGEPSSISYKFSNELFSELAPAIDFWT